MANKTRAEMITQSLRLLRILSATETASSEDSGLVGPILDSLHAQLIKRKMTNSFPTSAFPDWAQQPFTKVLAAEIAPYYGRVSPVTRDEGERELAEQIQVQRKPRPIKLQRY